MRFLILGMLISFRLSGQEYTLDHFRQMQWLEASWRMETENGPRWEIWSRINDSTYIIRGLRMGEDGDRVLVELISCRLRGGHLYYIPAVPGQNEGQPVPFIITQISPRGFTAENPRHDFPQRIVYVRKGRRRMVATISGRVKGKERIGVFKYRKVR